MSYILQIGGHQMKGREDEWKNNLFYTCSLIEYISRETMNNPKDTTKILGKKRIQKILSLADIYHSDNIERVADDFIRESGIKNGQFDNTSPCKYSIPSYWDIGKVYKRLILMVAEQTKKEIIDVLYEVFTSKIVDLIEDYNSSFYYDSPSLICAVYQNNCDPRIEDVPA